MDHYDVYQVGGRLWSLRKLLKTDPRRRAYQRLDLLLATAAVCHRTPDQRSAPAHIDSDTAFIARILLGLLQRGHASFVSPRIEDMLLTRKYRAVPELEPEIGVNDDEREAFIDQLLSSLVAPEEDTSPDWSFISDSQEELDFLKNHLASLLGDAVGLVEAQRPLSTMLPENPVLQERFAGQRVDFALETPSGAKIVFEVDGIQHNQPNQALLDRERDRALQQANWHVERITTTQIRGRHLAFNAALYGIVDNDWTLKHLKEQTDARAPASERCQRARKLALTPHAVARIQLAILLAMLNGELSLDTPEWSVGIVERDRACAEMALIDLLEQLAQLGSLYGIKTPVRVRLVVVPAYLGSTFQNECGGARLPQMSTRYVPADTAYELLPGLDVLIDVSLRSRPADIRHDEIFPTKMAKRSVPTYEIRSAYRRAPEAFRPWPAPRSVIDPEGIEDPIRYFMQMLFRKSDFREKQLDVLKRAFERRDVLGLLPTGGGKSLTFQLATLLSPGVSVIVAPLKSLIDDQVDNLHRAGINRVASIHSGMNMKRKEQALRDIVSGYPRFIYVAPERFHSKTFREELAASPVTASLAFAVIDEAHCVSEWGHDFRPAYLSVSHQARSLFRSAGGTPPIMALTATASSTVLTDILRELDFDPEDREALVSVPSFDRNELKFLPIIGPPEAKKADLGRAIRMVASEWELSEQELFEDPTIAGVVFCRYVNGDFGVVGVEDLLKQSGIAKTNQVRFYAGGQPKKWNGTGGWEEHKKQVQGDFKDDRFSALVATSSFGMGIDKRNIRYTVHYGIPQSLEALAQEAGRAGRDKEKAVCAIVFTPENLNPETDYLAPDIDIETARKRYEQLRRNEQGDASRLMFLHTISYPGVDYEVRSLVSTFQTIADAWSQRGTEVLEHAELVLRRPWSDSESKSVDKALYRLSVLGVVADYTIDYRAGLAEADTVCITPGQMEDALNGFVRRYIPPENARKVLANARDARDPNRPYDHALRAICEFTYEVIEKSRREGIRRVVECFGRTGGDGEAFSKELNQYLSHNTFTGRIAEIVKRADAAEWFDVLSDAHNHELAIQLVNAAERELESNPTHAGLHLLAGLANIQRDVISSRAIAQRLIAGMRYYESSFGKTADDQEELARQVLQHIAGARSDRLDHIVSLLVGEFNSDTFAIAAYPHVSSTSLKRKCAVPWLRQARDTARSLRETTLEISR